MSKDSPSTWMTFKEALDHLGVSRATLYRWCTAGTIPHRWVGAQLRFVPSELREWSKQRSKRKAS